MLFLIVLSLLSFFFENNSDFSQRIGAVACPSIQAAELHFHQKNAHAAEGVEVPFVRRSNGENQFSLFCGNKNGSRGVGAILWKNKLGRS